MKRQGAVFTVTAGILLLAGFLGACRQSTLEGKPDCDLDKGLCIKRIGQVEVTLDINPKPVKAMRELAFTLSVRGAEAPGELALDLSMPGMYMGKNLVPMKRGADGTYRGEGVIPKCPSGRRLWTAEADIPGTGKISFTFHVSY